MDSRSSNTSLATRAIATVLGTLCAFQSSPAFAYGNTAHQQIINNAFQVMRLVTYQQEHTGEDDNVTPAGKTSLWTTPTVPLEDGTAITPQEWQAFMEAISTSTYNILAADSNLGSMGACELSGKHMWELDRDDHLKGAAPNAAGLYRELHPGYVDKQAADPDQGCSTKMVRHGKLFTALNDTNFPGRIAGTALGSYAVAPDNYTNDWGLVIAPFQSLFMGTGQELANLGIEAGLAIFLAPFVCAWRWFSGKSCGLNDIRDVADSANILEDIVHLIPSPFAAWPVGEDQAVGFGHFMNLGPRARNFYDDIGGLHYDTAGYRGTLGNQDIKLGLIADTAGLVVEPRHSDGVRNYEIRSDEVHDGHARSQYRTNSRWRGTTYTHQEMTPLDNMAYYGWRIASSTGHTSVHGLQWPLHALGDVAAPHHLISTTGWGHRSYENAVNTNWENMHFLDSTGVTHSIEFQYEQARELLVRALFWRRRVVAWRARNVGAFPLDVPVRDLITEMATRNYSYIVAGDENTYGGPNTRIDKDDLPAAVFAYNDDYRSKIKNGNDDLEQLYIDDYTDEMRHLVENAMAGALGFLSAAGESMGPHKCGDTLLRTAAGEECDDSNLSAGDGCSPDCKVEAGWECNTEDWPSVCTLKCGNGLVEDNEVCDDGDRDRLDGCDQNCQVEANWTCGPNGSGGSTCVRNCGNGVVEGPEQCDDGNSVYFDGCTGTCFVEEGWQCTTINGLSHCATVCGDGIVTTPQEECDLGSANGQPGAACSIDCKELFIVE